MPNVRHHVKFHQNEQAVVQISQFLILKMADFQNLFLAASQVGKANVHHHTKFHQNRSNGRGAITFNVVQNGGRPSSWIFQNLNF